MVSIRALQLGSSDYSKRVELEQDVAWSFEPVLDGADPEYDVAFVARALTDEEAAYLVRHVRAYCLFVREDLALSDPMDFLMRSRRGRRYAEADVGRFLSEDLRNYYSRPYGEKFNPHTMAISPFFGGSVRWNGYTEALLEGSFGPTMRQVAFWRGNVPVERGQAIDLWLEYQTSGDVQVELEVTQFPQGSVSAIQNVWKFSQADLAEPVTIDNDGLPGPVFVSLNAQGQGTLRISALHDRYSRRGVGAFLPGGRRWATSDCEELFTYFDPGDLKPPLSVYFSGYKTMEGFEGYRMMRRMGCPFLLVSEPRLEGGAFYLGTQEYEDLVCEAIDGARRALGFAPEEVVLSGLSMGTFGALYYGTRIPAHDIVVGKPLVSLGSMAKNERLQRPGVFPTSLDVLWKACGSLSDASVDRLNHRFWDRFDETDWSGRTIYAAYMIEDDYDQDAYQRLLSHVSGTGAKVIGKGLHGRHNDDTRGIVSWFIGQYWRVLRGRYGRNQGRDGRAR
ncbi:MAG: accessory Sec system protein Asp2 [Coriobacteriales bacterium]